MGLMTKLRLIFVPSVADDGDNVGAYIRSSDGSLITSTDGKLDVNIVESTKQQILNATDLIETYNWSDRGLSTERINTVVYTSPTYSGTTLTKTFAYTLVETDYSLDSITWSIS